MNKGALLSDCKTYRYLLTRVWNDQAPRVTFVMLNPSTADADVDDPTIRKCIGFAERWGYGGINVVNLFAYRATNPADLLKASDPIGSTNGVATAYACSYCSVVVIAWGAHGSAKAAGPAFRKVLEALHPTKLHLLGVNNDGSPKHPLYVPYNTALFSVSKGYRVTDPLELPR